MWDVCLCWFPHSWNIADPRLENQPKWTDVPVLMDIQPRHMCQPLCSNMSNKKRGSWRKHVEKPHDAIPSSNEGDREEIHVYMHTVLYKASASKIPSLSVLMKRTGPVGLLMEHTSWKGSANSSFCKKRKMNSKWAFLKPFVRWLFNAQHMSTALTAGQLQ